MSCEFHRGRDAVPHQPRRKRLLVTTHMSPEATEIIPHLLFADLKVETCQTPPSTVAVRETRPLAEILNDLDPATALMHLEAGRIQKLIFGVPATNVSLSPSRPPISRSKGQLLIPTLRGRG